MKLTPGSIPSVEVQKEFVDEIQELIEKAKKGEIHLLFFDPTHQIHNTVIGKFWQPKGDKGTIKLPSNTGRKRISVIAGINIINQHMSSVITKDNCDKEMIQEVLQVIRNDYKDGKKIVIILDNASYNRAYATQDKAKELNIELKFLPSYCPNLNLIERLWKFMKKKILKCVYYKTFNEFFDAIKDFCKNLSKYKDEIKTLISQKFQIIKAD